MKKLILTLALVAMTLAASANSVRYFTRPQAIRVANTLDAQSELMIYCGYEYELATYVIINEVWAEPVNSKYYEIWLYGYDAYTGEEIYMPLDLSCIWLFNSIGNRMYSAAQYLRFRSTVSTPNFYWTMPPYNPYTRYYHDPAFKRMYTYHYDIHRYGWRPPAAPHGGPAPYHPYYMRTPHTPAPVPQKPFTPGVDHPTGNGNYNYLGNTRGGTNRSTTFNSTGGVRTGANKSNNGNPGVTSRTSTPTSDNGIRSNSNGRVNSSTGNRSESKSSNTSNSRATSSNSRTSSSDNRGTATNTSNTRGTATNTSNTRGTATSTRETSTNNSSTTRESSTTPSSTTRGTATSTSSTTRGTATSTSSTTRGTATSTSSTTRGTTKSTSSTTRSSSSREIGTSSRATSTSQRSSTDNGSKSGTRENSSNSRTGQNGIRGNSTRK